MDVDKQVSMYKIHISFDIYSECGCGHTVSSFYLGTFILNSIVTAAVYLLTKRQ